MIIRMPRRKIRNCLIEDAETGSEKINSNDGEDEEVESLSQLSLSLSLNSSSADTVLLSQNSHNSQYQYSQYSQSLKVEDVEAEEPRYEDTQTQILDQSYPSSPRQSQTKAKEKSPHTEVKNSGEIYWLNEILKSRSKPKKLDIEDISFQLTPASSHRLSMSLTQNPEETLKDFLGGKADWIVKEGIRHPAKLNRRICWTGCESASSSKAGKRKRSSSAKKTPRASTSNPVSSRSKRRKSKYELKENDSVKNSKRSSPEGFSDPATPKTSRVKGKKEQPQGTCPICNKSMKLAVLARHAGEAAVTNYIFTIIFSQPSVRDCPSPGCQARVSTMKKNLWNTKRSLYKFRFNKFI